METGIEKKREKILNGIRKLLKSTGITNDGSFDYTLYAAEGLIKYLHSQNVVISLPDEDGNRWLHSLIKEKENEN